MARRVGDRLDGRYVMLPGRRDNPIEVRTPHDVDRASRHVHRPSENQARAGNYQKGHVSIAGLSVTIETPQGGIRTGIAPDGTPWSVTMPAPYGYIKRSVGADDDQVDVYIGPVAHVAHLFPVWVIDQIDADSGDFDEHKCLIGFSDVTSVKKTYLAAFSDGRGHQRVGAVVRTTFDNFRKWLKSGLTKRPMVYRYVKSASDNIIFAPYVSTPPCVCVGGSMSSTTSPPVEKAASDPRALGQFTKILGRVLGHMPVADRTALMQDAAAFTSTEIAKTEEMLNLDENAIGFVEDQWDGPPDGSPRVAGSHGPGSTAAPGVIPTGPSQAASGNGAMKMEGEYSRHAPQGGVQTATEKLGREIAGMHGAMKSMVRALQGLGTQIEVLKAGVATIPAADSLQTLVDTAVAKAIVSVKADIGKTVAKAVAKAESEKEDEKEEKEDEDKEASKADLVSKAEEDVKEETEEEDEDEKKESSKAAATMRLMAKSRLKFAWLRIAKAAELATDDKDQAAQMARLASVNIVKAQGYVEASKALQEGKAGLSTQVILRGIAKAKKGLPASQTKMQDEWPESKEKKVHKSETPPVATPPGPTQADLAKAMEQIQAAASGMGMLNASVSEMMSALSRGSSGEGGALPPVFAIAKAGGSELGLREAELTKLRDSQVITFDDHEKARDALMRARMGLPHDIINGMINRLPEAARAVLTRPAA